MIDNERISVTMASSIHPTAIVDSGATIGENVTIGPYVVVENNVFIGDGCEIGSHALIAYGTTLGKSCRIFHGASVGTIPQDLKYKGEVTTLAIGDNTIIREFCTINRGTKARGETVIGKNCALLAYCHVAHDCVLGDKVVMSNNAVLGGHIEVGNYVVIGGLVGIHQFCRIGDYAFIGARGLVLKDIIPFSLCAAGPSNKERIVGINKVGLERNGFDSERRAKIKRAYKILFRDGLAVKEALVKLSDVFQEDEDIQKIINFIQESDRGIYNMNV